VRELEAISLANKLCNDFGLDTIGTGATVAWVMECFEKGVITEQELGFRAPYGDADAMVRITDMIAQRKGMGDILANGSRDAARKLGKGQESLITAKGSEMPAHMPQAKRSLALIYAVNTFGADHQSSEHDPMIEEGAAELVRRRMSMIGFDQAMTLDSLGPEKVRFALMGHRFYSFLDSAALCQFVWGPAWTLYGPGETLEFVRAATGWMDFSLDELLQVGERRLNMLRAFNAREGLDSRQDYLPDKVFTPLGGTGPTAGVAITHEELEAAKTEYYRQAGWDTKTGNPTPATLARLGLEWVSSSAA
jgi:aldehyde:ferredoxin oxidoreductase